MPRAFPGGKSRLGAVALCLVLLGVGLGAVELQSAAVSTAFTTGPAFLDPIPAFEPWKPAVVDPTIGDNGALSISQNGHSIRLQDSIADHSGTSGKRSYEITLSTSSPSPHIEVNLTTLPQVEWALPGNQRTGPAALPPLSDWNWKVLAGSQNDTSNWLASTGGVLNCTTAWQNATFTIIGTAAAVVPVTIHAGRSTSEVTPALGLDSAGITPRNATPLEQLVGPLGSNFSRWNQASFAPARWDAASQAPMFNVTDLPYLAKFASAMGLRLMVQVPVGTWGDGNTLPAGMPLNTSFLVVAKSGTGYFPTVTAYKSFIRTFVEDAEAAGLPMTYINIGNEPPVANNLTVTEGYTQLFNAAAGVIHQLNASILVGSDMMTIPSEFTYFAENAKGVGYLSFHFYGANGACPIANESYCPPDNVGGYLTDWAIWNKSANFAHGATFLPPYVSQPGWYNLTGQWLPILDAESNVNAYHVNGTDPRQQTLFGAGWFASQLIDAASVNLSLVSYYSLQGPRVWWNSSTGPYGGFGYGMTSTQLNGSPLLYAPYFALRLWGPNFPAGSAGLSTLNPDSNVALSYAVKNGTGVNVIIVNRVGVPISVTTNVVGRPVGPARVTVLDGRSYQESYNPELQNTTVSGPGLAGPWTCDTNDSALQVGPYGIALLDFPSAEGSNSSNASNPQNNTGGGNDTCPNCTAGASGQGLRTPPPGHSQRGTLDWSMQPGTATTFADACGTNSPCMDPALEVPIAILLVSITAVVAIAAWRQGGGVRLR